MRRIFTEFFEEALGLNYTSLYMRALIPSVGSVYSLPLANWYLAPPHIYQTLSKLKVLMFSWFQSRYPIEAVGCPMFPHDFMNRSMAGGGFSIARCWAFIGEQLTVMYLTAETSLYLLSGCEGEELQRWRSDFPVEKGLLTKHVHKLYEEVSVRRLTSRRRCAARPKAGRWRRCACIRKAAASQRSDSTLRKGMIRS